MADRLDWIFDTSETAALEAKYDQWAATYDDDHDEWGWRGPQLAAEALVRLAADGLPIDAILDAGCGTGRAGVELRKAGWTGRLIGVDLSSGMLGVANEVGAYDELLQGSVLDMSIPDGAVGAVISTGVFTHGHVGGEGFTELCRVTAAGGLISMTQRLDLIEQFAEHDRALVDAGRWKLVERAEPANFHTERAETQQVISTWRCLRSE